MKKKITVELDEVLYREVKIFCALNDRNITELIPRAALAPLETPLCGAEDAHKKRRLVKRKDKTPAAPGFRNKLNESKRGTARCDRSL